MKLSGQPGRSARARRDDRRITTGKAYLDFAGGYGVFTLGHRHPRVVAAVTEQLETDGALRQDDVRSARWDAWRGGSPRSRRAICEISFFANSGTEAVEGALKLARAATGRAQDRRDARTRFTARRSARCRSAAATTFAAPSRRCSSGSCTCRSATPRRLRPRSTASRGLHRRAGAGRGRRQRSAAWLSVAARRAVRRRGRAA